MADYLPTNTPRLRVSYTGPRGSHKIQFRGAVASTDAILVATARTVVSAMMPFLLNTTSFTDAAFAAEGSEIFLPVTWGAAITRSGGVDADNSTPYGAYLNWVGRSIAGSRCSWYIFNVAQGNLTANNRLTPAETAAVTAVRDALIDPTNGLAAIDQNPFAVYNYANSGINDHVARKSRLA